MFDSLLQPTKAKLLLAALINLLLVILNIIASAGYTTTGQDLQQLISQTQALRAQNQDLNRQLSQELSLTKLASKANDSGFQEPNSKISISPSNSPVALFPDTKLDSVFE